MTLAVPQGRQGGIDEAVGVRKEGYVPQKLALTKQTAEGVASCGAILALAQAHGVDMPIVASVTAVVQEGRSATEFGRVLVGDMFGDG